jgi:predicted transcriptional regulator
MSVKLPEPLAARLTRAARERGMSKSRMLREALEAGLAKRSRIAKGSALDGARDLVGRVAGPRDLSFAKKHLRGYGR